MVENSRTSRAWPLPIFGFERLDDTEVVLAHSDDLPPGLLQDNVDTMVRLLPGVPSVTFLKKSLCQGPGHTQRKEDSTELETIPCTISDTTGVEECADQLCQVQPVSHFYKSRVQHFFAYFYLS